MLAPLSRLAALGMVGAAAFIGLAGAADRLRSLSSQPAEPAPARSSRQTHPGSIAGGIVTPGKDLASRHALLVLQREHGLSIPRHN